MLPANWRAVGIFLRLSTQWRVAPMGGALGLDYGAIEPVLRLSGIKAGQWPDLFDRLRTMERAALDAMP